MTSSDDQLCRRNDYVADVNAIAAARNEAADFVADRFGAMSDVEDGKAHWLVERLRMVLSELCTNAVEAAPGRWFRVEVALVANGDGSSTVPDSVVCTVTSPFEGLIDETLRLGVVPSPIAERGRGLAIVDALADRAHIERSLDSVMVVAELDLDGGS